jgi:hypothetical protein
MNAKYFGRGHIWGSLKSQLIARTVRYALLFGWGATQVYKQQTNFI